MMVLLWSAKHAGYRLKIHLPPLFKFPEPLLIAGIVVGPFDQNTVGM